MEKEGTAFYQDKPDGKTEGEILFVSGIDTGIGKSYATGYLAREWNAQGISTITQKLVQTGNREFSEDIEVHRSIMGCGILQEDMDRLTMPEIFSYPCSPHLAAEIDGRELDLGKVERYGQRLASRYDRVLLEGAGGLLVPLTRQLLTIDYVAQKSYPVVLVTSGRLGSINHTLLALEAMQGRGIYLHTLVYNHHDDALDARISEDTRLFVKDWINRYYPSSQWIDLPVLS